MHSLSSMKGICVIEMPFNIQFYVIVLLSEENWKNVFWKLHACADQEKSSREGVGGVRGIICLPEWVDGGGGGVPGLIIKILKIFCLIFIFSGGESGCPVEKADFRIPPNDFVKEL